MGGDCLAATDGIASFVGPGLDVHLLDADLEHRRDRFGHGPLERLEFRPLRQNGDIHVLYRISRGLYPREDFLDESTAGGILPFRISIGKMLSYVSPRQR